MQLGGGICLQPNCLTHNNRAHGQSIVEGVGQNILNGHNNHTHSGYNNASGYNMANNYANDGYNNVVGYNTGSSYNHNNGYNNTVSGCNNTSNYNNTPSYVLSGYTTPDYNPPAYPSVITGHKNDTVHNDATGYHWSTTGQNNATGLINPMGHTIPVSQPLASTVYNVVSQQQWSSATMIAHTGHNSYNFSQFEMTSQATQPPCPHYLMGNRLIFDPN